MQKKLWYYSAYIEEEFTSEGYESREDCIADASEEAKSIDGQESFWVGLRHDIDITPCARDILERTEEKLYEEVGDYADGQLEFNRKTCKYKGEDYLQELLNEAWKKYLDKIGGISCFQIVEVEEFDVENHRQVIG